MSGSGGTPVGKCILSLANLGEPTAFLERARGILPVSLEPAWLWPERALQDSDEYAESHWPLTEGPLQLEAFECRPLGSVQDSAIVIDADSLITVPAYRYKEAEGAFFTPAYAMNAWTKEQRTWLKKECEPLPLLTAEQACEQIRKTVQQLASKNNKVIICEAFEYIATLPDAYESIDELMVALLHLNVFVRELAAETGAFLLHANMVMEERGALSLDSDFRKSGIKTAELLADELRHSLTESSVLDV